MESFAEQVEWRVASPDWERSCNSAELLCSIPASGSELELRHAQVLTCEEETGEMGCSECRANPPGISSNPPPATSRHSSQVSACSRRDSSQDPRAATRAAELQLYPPRSATSWREPATLGNNQMHERWRAREGGIVARPLPLGNCRSSPNFFCRTFLAALIVVEVRKMAVGGRVGWMRLGAAGDDKR